MWSLLISWVFSTVGAFGGVLAGVGHMTIFGLGSYASSLRDVNESLNRVVTDSVRVSNQWLVGMSAAISSFNYYRMKRIVIPLGLTLGVGAVIGSIAIPMLTAGKLSFRSYQGYFGLFTLIVGFVLLYEITPRGMARKKKASEAAKAFENRVRELKKNGNVKELEKDGVNIKEVIPRRIRFTFFGEEFSFNPVLPFFGGIVIAGIASLIGVGGGFLYVPFLTSVVGLPYFIVAGTSALAVIIGMVVKGVSIDFMLIGVELVGVIIGSLIGSRTSKYIPERYMKIIFTVLAFYVGLRYTIKGFFGFNLLP